ncbi:MAG: HAD-IA family hydrolase [Verrucomicrobia bacterium]|nr:HAD-IA family hydrolase [Verrucomicrobiota bacterium]
MSKPDQLFAGVIFDMDGVLCASEPFIAEAACRMFAEAHGVKVQPHDFAPFVGTGEDRFLGGVAEKYGVRLTMPRDKERTYAIYLEIIKGRLQPLPGVHEFIAKCRRRGLRLAVATSADRVKLDGNLREIGVPAEQFDASVTGSEVTHKKPHPEIFLRAAEKLGLPPARCLVVEDAPSGVAAAKAAGSRCLGLTTSFDAETLRKAGADWLAPDLAGVSAAILDY